MKTRWAILACFTALVLTLCSCNSNGEYSFQKTVSGIKLQEIAYASDGNDGGIHTYDEYYSRMESNRAAEDIPQEVTVQFEGKPYTGTYSDTVYEDFFNTKRQYCYDMDIGNFRVDASDGSLEALVVPDLKVCRDMQKGDKTIEDCKDLALKIAEQFINIDDYELTENGDYDGFNIYQFKRMICGYETRAMMNVCIDTFGNLELFSKSMTEEYDKFVSEIDENELKKNLTLLDSETAHSAIEEKLKTIYPSMTDSYVKKTYLVLTPDDSFGLAFLMVANENEIDGVPVEIGKTYILVTLDQE